MINAKIGRYEIVKVLGKGGMGVVYLARDPILQRFVAIKVLSPHLASDETVVARFINEARIAASLQHPNIVTVYEAGQDGNLVFMVMEYVDGQDLASLLRQRGKLHPDEAIAILKAVASALDYAHQRGVIHRDVKPSNVLVSEDGVVKLMDFGIARVVGGERHTKTGVLVGTPEYMAPELWEGRDADKFSDLYSLGVMAYEMLTGEVPFTGDTPIAIGYKHVYGEVPRSRSGEAVDEVLKVAMAKERGRRFESGSAFVRALEDALKGGSVPSVHKGQSYGQEKVVTSVGVYWIPKKVGNEKSDEGKQRAVQTTQIASGKVAIFERKVGWQFALLDSIVAIAIGILIPLLEVFKLEVVRHGSRSFRKGQGFSLHSETKIKPSQSEGKAKRIVKIYVKPVQCDCLGEHGNIFAVYSDGTSKQLTHDGLATDPKLAPDGRTCGWLEGMHLLRTGDPPEEFQAGDLILYRDGRILRKIGTGLNASWQFWEGGKQVAIMSSEAIRFSPFKYGLYDVETGRLVGTWSDEQREKGEKPPQWVQALLGQE